MLSLSHGAACCPVVCIRVKPGNRQGSPFVDMLDSWRYIAGSLEGTILSKNHERRPAANRKIPRETCPVFGSPSIEEEEIQEVVDRLRSQISDSRCQI